MYTQTTLCINYPTLRWTTLWLLQFNFTLSYYIFITIIRSMHKISHTKSSPAHHHKNLLVNLIKCILCSDILILLVFTACCKVNQTRLQYQIISTEFYRMIIYLIIKLVSGVIGFLGAFLQPRDWNYSLLGLNCC